MPRRLLLGLALAATVLAACGGSAGPVLTDPKEILTKAVEVAAATKTVHLQAELAGTFKMDLTGTGEGSALDLKGTSLSGDIDIANKKFKAALAVPALLGLTADFVVIDLSHPAVLGADDEALLARVILGAPAAAVADVFVAGQRIVAHGRHPQAEETARLFEGVVRGLLVHAG